MRVRSVLAVAAAGLLLAGCAGTPTAVPPAPAESGQPAITTPDDPLAAFYDQELEWRNCGDAECTRVLVPIDYQDPTAGTTELAVTKVPARGEPIGALFVNPGGPGGSAFDYARASDYIVSPAVRNSFDIVGVDPRGVAKSDPIRCLSDAEIDRLFAADGTPDDAQEVQQLIADSAFFGQACDERAGDLWKHMGTINSARDLDIVRAVLGEPVFNYLGKSYGSAIGISYSELFPDRVGRMVLDGVLPVDISHEQATYDQLVAFEQAVQHFASDCAQSRDCPFFGNADDVLAQLQDFLQRLDTQPLPTKDGRELTESLGTYAVVSHLYFPSIDYRRLRAALGEAVTQGDGSALVALVDERVERSVDGRYLSNATDAFYAVTCIDLPYDGTVDDVIRLADQWDKEAPTFGRTFAWGMLVCADWPASTTERITSNTAGGANRNPILIVSTAGDAATPHGWGVELASSMADAHLLTWDEVNHTAYLEGSTCIDRAVDAYLLAGELPPPGLVCS
jgi:pimeloyl-ACP methyl ester carboxylesterase